MGELIYWLSVLVLIVCFFIEYTDRGGNDGAH